MATISRRAYAEMYGPTTGDRIRLADTELFIEIEKDYAIYGEEVKFGGGKVIRDGMGQSQRMSADCMDTVITNALIVDWTGIYKADIGVKRGRIVNKPTGDPRDQLHEEDGLEAEGDVRHLGPGLDAEHRNRCHGLVCAVGARSGPGTPGRRPCTPGP